MIQFEFLNRESIILGTVVGWDKYNLIIEFYLLALHIQIVIIATTMWTFFSLVVLIAIIVIGYLHHICALLGIER